MEIRGLCWEKGASAALRLGLHAGADRFPTVFHEDPRNLCVPLNAAAHVSCVLTTRLLCSSQ